MKKQRAFWMQAQGKTAIWTIQYPLTLHMDIANGIYSSLGEGTFELYNLAASARKDLFIDWNNRSEYRQVTLKAGYLSWSAQGSYAGPPPQNQYLTSAQINALPVIFKGNMTKCQSKRSGPNWITAMSAWDGGYGTTRGDISTTFNLGAIAGTPAATYSIFSGLGAAMMPHVTIGYLDPTLTLAAVRPQSFSGKPWDIIQQLAAGILADAFIVQEKLYVVKKGHAVPGLVSLPLITSDTGLVNTPSKQDTYVSWDMIFEPRLKIGQLVKLQSLETEVNGQYTVGSLEHRGQISGAAGGELLTTVTCMYGVGFKPYGSIQQ